MSYGNPNLAFVNGYQYITYAGTDSEASAAFNPNTIAVHLYATTDCWVNIGPGTPVAAAPSAEKVRTMGFKLIAGVERLVAIPRGSEAAPISIAVLRVSADGTLEVTEYRE